VKCDEGKPACRSNTGRRCDGYSSSGQANEVAPRPESAVAWDNDLTSRLDGRAFIFFVQSTASRIAGHFRDDAWGHIVPQFVHANPAIRHAVNALVGLDRAFWSTASTTESPTQEMRAFSTKHYIHALNHFRTLLSSPRPTPTITMACLLLFIHIEALRENFVSTIAHVKQMSLLLGIATAQPQQCERLEPTIGDALTRIDIQASAYMGSRVPELAPQAFIPLP